MEKKIKFRLSWIKYLLVVVVFAVWMIFFDTNSWINRAKLKDKLTELQNDTTFYQQETKRFQTMTKELQTDMETLEKLGREEYRMKRDDEVVYLIQK